MFFNDLSGFHRKLCVLEMNFRNKKENPSQRNVKALRLFSSGSGCGVDLWTVWHKCLEKSMKKEPG
jgi:hypothetical protein